MRITDNKRAFALAFALTAMGIACQMTAAKAAVFDWSFSGQDVSGSGQLTANPDIDWTNWFAEHGNGNQIYDVTSMTGTATPIGGDSPLQVTGPITGEDFADVNWVVYPASSFYLGGDTYTVPIFLDVDNGLSFYIGNTQYDIVYNSYPTQACGPIGYCLRNGGDPVLVTFELSTGSGVPEPSTWAMMMVGVAGVGFVAYRRSKPAVLAS